MGKLTDKVALVTGGATGLGRAITLALAAQGCRVAFHHFRNAPDELITELTDMGCDAFSLQGDLTLGTNFHNTHTTPESASYTIEHQIPLGRAVRRRTWHAQSRSWPPSMMDLSLAQRWTSTAVNI